MRYKARVYNRDRYIEVDDGYLSRRGGLWCLYGCHKREPLKSILYRVKGIESWEEMDRYYKYLVLGLKDG